jgi:ACT domain-containing protein
VRAIVTALGADKPGIIARLSGAMFDANVNILDIRQTVLQNELFAMTMLVDMKDATLTFDEVKERLAGCARELAMDIRLQREEIFRSMHRV